MVNAKELKLKNDNNILGCNIFMQIHFAPKEPIPESVLMSQLYYVPEDSSGIAGGFFCKLIDLHRFTFKQLTNQLTFLSNGINAVKWQKQWLARYPETKDTTMMAAYYYEKTK